MLDRLVPAKTKAAALQKMLLDQVRRVFVCPGECSGFHSPLLTPRSSTLHMFADEDELAAGFTARFCACAWGARLSC